MTELIEAAKAGDQARVRELLATAPELARARTESGETALMAALYHGHSAVAQEIAEATVRAGGVLDIFAAAALGRDADVERGLTDPAQAAARSHDGWTALHLAAFFGHRTAAARLLDAGADADAVSVNGMRNTPLHAATAGGRTDVALLLIERGADVKAADAGGHTPLHIAAEAGNVEVVRALLQRGADPLAVDAEDKTPLSRAAARNHSAIIDLLNLGA